MLDGLQTSIMNHQRGFPRAKPPLDRLLQIGVNAEVRITLTQPPTPTPILSRYSTLTLTLTLTLAP